MRSRKAARAFWVGFCQGAAELLPVSSSTHAALLEGEQRPGSGHTLTVLLHGATGAALLGGVGDGEAVPIRALLPAVTLPAATGFFLDRRFAGRKAGARGQLVGLFAGSAVMAAGELCKRGQRGAQEAGVKDGLWLGVAGTLSLLPGFSRSGTTAAVARLRGFSPPAAARLSWACGLPLLLGAGALRLGRALAAAQLPAGEVALPAAAGAYLGGRVGLRLGLQRLGAERPLPFAAYRAGLAALLLARARASAQSRSSSSG